MKRVTLKEILEILDEDTEAEIYDIHANMIIKAPIYELQVNDVGLWDKEVITISPQHNQRENYLEITIY